VTLTTVQLAVACRNIGPRLKVWCKFGLLQEISGSFRLLSQTAGRTQNVPADSQGESGAKHPVMARQSDSSVDEIISTEESDVAPTPGG
jgi:hypothetical protein